jgi:hypothetical protein
VKFIVDIDGSITDISVASLKKFFKTNSEKKRLKLEKSIPAEAYKEIEEEAKRVVSLSPKWKPGMQQNKPVRVAYTLPITFRLE